MRKKFVNQQKDWFSGSNVMSQAMHYQIKTMANKVGIDHK